MHWCRSQFGYLLPMSYIFKLPGGICNRIPTWYDRKHGAPELNWFLNKEAKIVPLLSCVFWHICGRIETLPHTVWKFHDFSITYILCEINFGDSRSPKCVTLTHFDNLNFDFHAFLQFLKAENSQINTIHSPKNGNNCSFRSSRFSMFDFT